MKFLLNIKNSLLRFWRDLHHPYFAVVFGLLGAIFMYSMSYLKYPLWGQDIAATASVLFALFALFVSIKNAFLSNEKHKCEYGVRFNVYLDPATEGPERSIEFVVSSGKRDRFLQDIKIKNGNFIKNKERIDSLALNTFLKTSDSIELKATIEKDLSRQKDLIFTLHWVDLETDFALEKQSFYVIPNSLYKKCKSDFELDC